MRTFTFGDVGNPRTIPSWVCYLIARRMGEVLGVRARCMTVGSHNHYVFADPYYDPDSVTLASACHLTTDPESSHVRCETPGWAMSGGGASGSYWSYTGDNPFELLRRYHLERIKDT